MLRTLTIALFFVISATTNTTLAYDRYVIVNGKLMNATELAILDNVNGEYIPDGRYWLNYATGAWGYENGPMEGILGEDSNSTGAFSYDNIKDDFCVRNPGICP
jgi:hypothetical protein